MKSILSSTLIIFLIALTSACSRIPQRTANLNHAATRPQAPITIEKSRRPFSQVTRNQVTRNQVTRNQVTRNQVTRNQVTRNQVIRNHIPSTQQKSPSSQVTRNQVPVGYNPARQRMINIAASTIGTPYRWGGDNPQRGFDCSGLMTYVHKNALGIKIPRTTSQQRDQSRTISYSQLQPGDMLFFKTNRTTNHVGVYIGNRKFIHAPSSGKRVKVASMDSSYWYKRFVKFGTFM